MRDDRPFGQCQLAERAAAVKPDFRVTPENAAAVAAVVRHLDGIALAIELAAARVPAMTPAELARRDAETSS